ncbi:hypothetical protein H0H93_003791, partial [Arthromyces matolae]
VFAKVPDPAYPEALLLEQHQAPITAALTPAFSSESTPEILASAIHACAVFVGCGVVTDVGRMGRILKLLTTAIEQSKGTFLILSFVISHLLTSEQILECCLWERQES